jgi:hypothetical protein
MNSATFNDHITLQGLRFASPQVLGAVRLVPICRDQAPGDLRIARQSFDSNQPEFVQTAARQTYASYIPHALIVTHSVDGEEAAFGSRFVEAKSKGSNGRVLHRMVKRDKHSANRFRMLPMHLAMEGLLAYQFGGPSICWTEYSKQAITRGLSPRWEQSVKGSWLPGLQEALALFEVHPHQVGVMIFVADALASVFVTSHPNDYFELHHSLIEDFYGALLVEYGLLYPTTQIGETRIDASTIDSLAKLRNAVTRARDDWAAYAEFLAAGLFKRSVQFESVRHFGEFKLERFIAELDPAQECHIGERIIRTDGALEYLKTYRMSAAQVRRAHLLQKLATAEWNLEICAGTLS